MENIINWLMNRGFDYEGAIKEAESMIKYHTTGIDAVSREYAIKMIVADID